MEGTIAVVVAVVALVVLLFVRLVRGSPPSFGATRYGQALGATARPPARPGEEALFTGAAPDGISWTIRVYRATSLGIEPSGEEHHFRWSTDAVRSDALLFVLSDDPADATLSQWRIHPGRTPEELEALERQADDVAEQLRPLLRDAARDPAASLDKLEALLREQQAQETARDAMQLFVATARPVALPPDLEGIYHAFTVDDRLAETLVSATVEALLRDWDARFRRHIGSIPVSLRVWVGDPDLRIEVEGGDLGPEAYQHIVDLGIALTRGYRKARA